MNREDYVKRIHKVRETFMHEIQKDAIVAAGGDVEGAQEHLARLEPKFVQLKKLQHDEERLFPALKGLIHKAIVLEDKLGELVAQFVKEHDAPRQQQLVTLILKALDELERAAQEVDAKELAQK